MNVFRKFKAYLTLREAIRLANERHLDGGGRFYILGGEDGKLVVANKKNFRILRRKGYIDKDATMQDAMNECFYFTPFRNGKGKINDVVAARKRRQFYIWYDHIKKASRGK